MTYIKLGQKVMIITKEIETNISHLNINYYKSLGYDVVCNYKILVPIEHLPKESNRNILRGYLLRKNLKKNDKTFSLLKYSPDDLRAHLSNLFINDMSWDNYGKNWHVDHIIHVTFFRDDSPCEIVNCLENLRPYDKKLNISRHNNMDEDCENLMKKYKTYIKENYIK